MTRHWMPLYIGDYLADTANLNTLQHGAYMLLIMHYWRHRGLPTEPGELASIARLTLKQWSSNARPIAKLFDSKWRHKRIDRELATADAQYERRSKAGKMGGLAHANAQAMLKQPQPQSPSPSKEEKKDSGADAPITKAKRGKSRATRLPEGHLPDLEYGFKCGLTRVEVEREWQRFKNHAAQNGRTCVDWAAAWRNWCLKAAEFMNRTPQETGTVVPFGFYAQFGSEQIDAWDAYAKATGRPTYPRDKKGGWNFPTEWPPDIPKAEAAE